MTKIKVTNTNTGQEGILTFETKKQAAAAVLVLHMEYSGVETEEVS